MTTTAEPLLPAARSSLYDRWLARVGADAVLRRRWDVLAPVLVTLLAAVLRFVRLGSPRDIVFDETYYVKDAWSQWLTGVPANWPDEANPQFLAGQTDIFLTTGSFIVHPPLGKWLIGAGMGLFGADSTFGWRFAVALFGTATVLVLYVVAKALTGSTAFATVAGSLLAIDGLAIVMSRISLLDGILTFFVLLAFWFVILDRRRTAERYGHDPEHPSPLGPVLWNRPWILAAGAAVGAATAVKWSGLYVLAALGVYLVVTDALARRRAGATFWPLGALRQGLVTFLQFVPIAVVLYLASWAGWFATDNGYDRHAVDANPATGFWSWVPLPLQNLWAYHQAIYGFHVGLTTPHSYQSPAWQWPLLIRPTSMYWNQDDAGVQAVSSIPNPLIWWAGVAAVLYLGYRFVRSREWRYALILTGVAATYVPWLLYPERTIFQFYTIAILPFMVLALTFALRDIAGAADDPIPRRTSGQRVVLVFLAVVAAVSALWYPVWTGITVPYEFWRIHNWMQTWI